jgi:hypothetical protein
MSNHIKKIMTAVQILTPQSSDYYQTVDLRALNTYTNLTKYRTKQEIQFSNVESIKNTNNGDLNDCIDSQDTSLTKYKIKQV